MEKGVKIKRVLVIASNTQIERQNSFKEELKKICPTCEVVIDKSGRFNRDYARRIAVSHLTTAIDENRPFDVVFCTSDSMTLGCLDAVAEITTCKECKKPRVIGYDGIPLIRQFVESGDSALERVIVQETHDIAVAAVEQLIRLFQGEDIKGAG